MMFIFFRQFTLICSYPWLVLSISLYLFGNMTTASAKDLLLPKQKQSLTLMSSFDFQATKRTMEKRALKPFPSFESWKSFKVHPYTDAPKIWTNQETNKILWVASYYFRRCKINMDISPLTRLPKHAIRKGKKLQFSYQARQLPSLKKNETIIFLTTQVPHKFKRSKRITWLFGLSWAVKIKKAGKKARWHRSVWVRNTLNYPVLAHELGHRWGLGHVSIPRNMLLNGNLLFRSTKILFESVQGYFSPYLLHFKKWQCKIMRKRIEKFRKRNP